MKVVNKEVLALKRKLQRAETETLHTEFEASHFSGVVMEFCPGGDLHPLRHKQPYKRFSIRSSRFTNPQIASSVFTLGTVVVLTFYTLMVLAPKAELVIVVPLLDSVLGAVVPVYTWFGALMSLIGFALLESSGSPPKVGDLLNFLSAVFFGVHMLRTEHISRSTDKENFLPLLGYEVCVVALFSTMWYFVGGWVSGVEDINPSSWTLTMFIDWMVTFPWVPALYTGIFSTGLCLWVEMAAMCDVSATETAIIYGLEPVWGAGFAWFVLGERWGTSGWIGATLVLGGSLTVQILGACSPILSRERKEIEDQLLVSEKQNGLSTSPIVVSSRKGISLKK